MTKLHELVAVEPDLQVKGKTALAECQSLFTGGQVRLVGQVRSYEPLAEDGERIPSETSEIATTVLQELDRAWGAFGGWIDVTLQKEVSNGLTKADVMVGEKVILQALPAPALLNLEKRLAEIKALIDSAPTLDPTEKWNWDPDQQCYVSATHQALRTKKVPKVLVKYEATKEHPAQTEVYSEDVPVGTWTVTKRSGMLTLAVKRQMLERVDMLIMATKAARQRANDLAVTLDHFAAPLWKYILKGE